MLFELEYPWIEWMVKTKIGKQTFDAKLDKCIRFIGAKGCSPRLIHVTYCSDNLPR